jgi:hypothetical protein
LQVWGVLKESKAFDSTPCSFGNEKNRSEPVFKWVPELLWKFGDLFLPQQWKLLKQDLLNLRNGIFIHGQGVIVDPTNSKHVSLSLESVFMEISGGASQNVFKAIDVELDSSPCFCPVTGRRLYRHRVLPSSLCIAKSTIMPIISP